MNLRQKLDYHYKAFNKSQISPDPLQFLHLYSDWRDIEVMGFIASVFAYGNVNQIINSLNRFVIISENHPYKFISSFNYKDRDKRLNSLYHRFYTSDDIINLFLVLKKVYSEYKSLKNLFMKFYRHEDENIKTGLSGFSNHFIGELQKLSKKKTIEQGSEIYVSSSGTRKCM